MLLSKDNKTKTISHDNKRYTTGDILERRFLFICLMNRNEGEIKQKIKNHWVLLSMNK